MAWRQSHAWRTSIPLHHAAQKAGRQQLACCAGTRPRRPSGRLTTSSAGCTSTTLPHSLAPVLSVCRLVRQATGQRVGIVVLTSAEQLAGGQCWVEQQEQLSSTLSFSRSTYLGGLPAIPLDTNERSLSCSQSARVGPEIVLTVPAERFLNVSRVKHAQECAHLGCAQFSAFSCRGLGKEISLCISLGLSLDPASVKC